MMTSHPDVCRKILASKFGDLRLPAKKVVNNETEHSNLNEVNISVVPEPSARALKRSLDKLRRTNKKKKTTTTRAQWPSGLTAGFPLMFSDERVGSNLSWVDVN